MNENVTFVLFLVLVSAMDSDNRAFIGTMILATLWRLYRMGQYSRKEEYEK